MRNNESGEFELVVGNKQLLSGFFIVVVLFALAFAMGYILGQQNSTHPTKAQADPGTSAVPVPSDVRPQPIAPVAPPVTAPAAPSGDAAKTAVADTSTPAATEPPHPQPSTKAAREKEPAATAPAAAPPTAPEAAPGSYWQVLATSNQDSAHALLQTLKDKGLPASLGPGPNNLTRVLVGPYSDTSSMGRAKTELEGMGIHPVRK